MAKRRIPNLVGSAGLVPWLRIGHETQGPILLNFLGRAE